MKKIALIMLTALGGMLFAAGAAKAQVPTVGAITADVPFPFYAGDTHFPAGEYVIKQLDPMNPEVLTISTADGRITSLMIVRQTNRPTNAPNAKSTDLTFNEYGTRFFLSSIHVEGSNNSTRLQKSDFENLISKVDTSGQSRTVPAEHRTLID